jgi:hypothetical protein
MTGHRNNIYLPSYIDLDELKIIIGGINSDDITIQEYIDRIALRINS